MGRLASDRAERLDPYGLAGRHVRALLFEHDEAVRLGHGGEDPRALRPRGPNLPSLARVRQDPALELASPDLLPHRLDGDGMKARAEQLTPPEELPEHRAHEEMEREHARHGVTGEAEEVGGADVADGDGASGLHRHLPEVRAAHLLEHGFDEVVLPDGDAAR